MTRKTNARQMAYFKKYLHKMTNTRVATGERTSEIFTLTLTDASAKKEFDLVELEKSDNYEISISRGAILPDCWKDMAASEKERFVLENEFEIGVHGIYIHKNLDKNLLQAISCYSEAVSMKIYEHKVSGEDLLSLSKFCNLEFLALRGKNVTDDIVPLFKYLGALKILDIYDTGITYRGVEKIKSLLPERCAIYGP